LLTSIAGLSLHARQKKWSGHGPGRTADDGLVVRGV